MEHQRLTRHLGQLADEAEPRPVDVATIISRAKARRRNRRGMLAVGGATAFVLTGAVATTMLAVGGGGGESVGAAARPTTTSPRPTLKQPGDLVGVQPAADERSRKLDSQLAAARADLIPAGFTAGDNPVHPIKDPLKFQGGPGRKNTLDYTARAMLTSTQGTATIQVWVLKNPPGTPLGHYDGQVFGPCQQGQRHCERRTLPDGTVATAQPNANPPGLTLSSALNAQRPDGTYIQVLVNVGEGTSPKPLDDAPFDAEQLFKFATVFSY